MERYFKKASSTPLNTPPKIATQLEKGESSCKRVCLELDPENPPADPGLRRPIIDYQLNDREKVRRIYLMRGPCQPTNHQFPQVLQGESLRRFNSKWFNDHPTWLEYSIEKDAAYCLCCYLFKSESKEHVADTTAKSLLSEIEALLVKHNLSLSRIRGQGYDGASNMQGEFNGLKALILKENQQAYYVHCFAHQLQLALVGIAKKNVNIASLFELVTNVVNLVGGSCKRHDILQEEQYKKVQDALLNSEVASGQGLNQATTLKRAGDTRWSSHYKTLISLTTMFSAVINVLDIIVNDMKLRSDQRLEAHTLLKSIQTYEFVFSLHLMIKILGITYELSQALQRKEQDIVNAITLVKISKYRLQLMRDNGWDSMMEEVTSFCMKHNIEILNMDTTYVIPGRSRRNIEKISTLHHFRVDLFCSTIDLQLQELNNRFNESNTELLLCVSCLSPNDSFSAFDKQKLIHLALMYPNDFPSAQLSTIQLDNQLETYILDMRSNEDFTNLKSIGELAEKLVEMKKNILYSHVYKLITLALILPVATATVERAFSAMKIIKNRLRNRISDQFMVDCLIAYIEKDAFNSIDDEKIMLCFQNMKSRRGIL